MYNMSVNQLKRAIAIKEQIASLDNELRTIFEESAEAMTGPKKKRVVSASVRKRIAAAQKARWANFRRNKSSGSAGASAKVKKKGMSRAARARLSSK
jgi:hypothetical protein